MEEKLTPAMKQYYEMKKAHEGSILFFRMGDFYEMFDEDAEIASRELGLTLTSRHKNSERPTPLAGIPYHAADKYLAQLTKKGYSVAICEQTSDPKLPGIVQRQVVRVVTPGTTLQDEVLDAKCNNYMLGIVLEQKTGLAHLALCDLTTGNVILTTRFLGDELRSFLYITAPAEIILPEDAHMAEELLYVLQNSSSACRVFRTIPKKTRETIEAFYAHSSIPYVPLPSSTSKNTEEALALILHYLEETQKQQLSHIQSPRIINEHGLMRIDENALRNLEILTTLRDGKKEGSLLGLFDHTMTSPGGRLLRSWILQPLTDLTQLQVRLDGVESFVTGNRFREETRKVLQSYYDIERLLSKLAMGRGNARDLLAIKISAEKAKEILDLLKKEKNSTLEEQKKQLTKVYTHETFTTTLERIEKTIQEEPPLTITEGGIIKDGVDPEIDELRHIRTHSQEWLLSYQEQQQQEHGIPTLKVKFNNVFGYFIEISKTHTHKAPAHYVRKQTTVNGERYTTPDLKVYEEKILTAEERINKKEFELFEDLRKNILSLIPQLLTLAETIAQIDVLSTLGEIAYSHKFVRPTWNNIGKTEIIAGRHPVVEERLRRLHEPYTPNNTILEQENTNFLLLTGPNMAGKSTYMRQVALITLLAQIGSFVPATSADLSIKDAIFTRVGASDNVSGGQSTFMVEMQEVSSILHYATKHSLIILDEVGRGTSTYDGLSLAWAIMEHIHDVIGATTILATHYHELIHVAEKLPKAFNASMAVAEKTSGVTFLHQIVSGGASRSYGIEVGHLAGLPESILESAKKHLHALEQQHQDPHHKKGKPQPSLFDLDHIPTPPPPQVIEKTHPIVEELKNLPVDEMTPIQALAWLSERKNKL